MPSLAAIGGDFQFIILLAVVCDDRRIVAEKTKIGVQPRVAVSVNGRNAPGVAGQLSKFQVLGGRIIVRDINFAILSDAQGYLMSGVRAHRRYCNRR